MRTEPFLDELFYRRYRRYYTYVEPIVTDPLVRGYFTLVASMFLVAFFLVVALSPTVTTILGLVKKIDDQKKTLATMDVKISNLVLAQENYSQIEGQLPLLLAAIPAKPDPAGVLTSVVGEATAAGIVVKRVQFGEISLSGGEEPKSGLKKEFLDLGIPTVQFSLTATGGSSQMQAFFETLENQPRIIRLKIISMDFSNGASQIDADVAGLAYYYAQK